MDDQRSDTEVHEQLPLTEATFFILLSLVGGKKHGYAIMKDVEGLSEGRILFSTGTLYPALKRMLDQGWIKRVEDEAEEETLRPRKAYTLSALGRRILSAETRRMDTLVTTAQALLGVTS